MVLRKSLKISSVLFLLGLIVFYFAQGFEAMLWFGVGGGLALFNFSVACLIVEKGLQKVRNKALLLAGLMLKSMSFVGLIAVVLMFTKPLLFPFTLGIGLVIFGLVIWAVFESRHSLKRALNH